VERAVRLARWLRGAGGARSDRPASAGSYRVVDTDATAGAEGRVRAEARAIKDLGDDEIVQVPVNLRGAEVKALQGVADRYGTNLTEALRRCIATQHWMDHQRSGGASLYLEGPGRRRRRVVFR
jgi:hypothetical protein